MNALSMFGRMNYGMSMISQFLVGGTIFYGYHAYSAYSAKAQDDSVKANLPKLKQVDPDIFNPFTPIRSSFTEIFLLQNTATLLYFCCIFSFFSD